MYRKNYILDKYDKANKEQRTPTHVEVDHVRNGDSCFLHQGDLFRLIVVANLETYTNEQFFSLQSKELFYYYCQGKECLNITAVVMNTLPHLVTAPLYLRNVHFS